MAAVIEFQDGTRATFSEGRWECASPDLARALDLRTETVEPNHRPWPEHDLAADVAALFGAHVVSADPPPEVEGEDAEALIY